MAKILILTIPNADEDVEQEELSFLLVGLQNGSATARTSEDSLAVLTKLNILLPKDPVIKLLAMYT